MTSIIATRTDPETGLDVPACSLCGWIISRIPRGKATKMDFCRSGHALAEHIIEKHPEKARELADKAKAESKVR